VVAVHNLADRPVAVPMDVGEQQGECLIEVLGNRGYGRLDRPGDVELPAYGCRWFRVSGGRWKLPGQPV
jgi:hypothetical protein